MLIRIFRDNQFFSVLVSFILLVLFWIISGYYSDYHPFARPVFDSGLFNIFPGIMKIDNLQVISTILNIGILVICSIYISGMMQRFQIIPKRTSLPGFIFILITAPYFHFYTGFSYALITFLFLLIILDLLFRSIDSKATSMRYFDVSLILSVASLINAYFILYAIFIIFVWFQFRGLSKWREFVFIIVGIAIPYIFYFAGFYLTDIKTENILNVLFLKPSQIGAFYNNTTIYTLGIFTGLFTIIASFHIIRNYMKMKIVTRKYALIFLVFFIVTILIAIFYRGIESDIIFFSALPLGFLFSYYFTTCRYSIFNQILFFLLIAGNLFVLFWK